jgi:hypothetical protein
MAAVGDMHSAEQAEPSGRRRRRLRGGVAVLLAALTVLTGCTSGNRGTSTPAAEPSGSSHPAIPDAAPAPLFNGVDLGDWRFVVDGREAPPGTAVTVRDGTIAVSGAPVGYLATRRTFGNYTLRYEWRFTNPAGGNSGLLVHIQQTTHQGTWPTCVEVQGMQSEAGLLLALGGAKGQFSNDRSAISRAVRPGEWNTTSVTAVDGDLSVAVNGVPVASGHSDLRAGPVGFQSEGAALQIRNITISTR